MTSIIVGDSSSFAIESGVDKYLESLGHRALGYFAIHVNGRSYGVIESEATLLACSYDEVGKRLGQKGTHIAPFAENASGIDIVDAYLACRFHTDRDNELFFGLNLEELSEIILSKNIVWAPDGDAAFDDGSHILHFDIKSQVRLIAFKNEGTLANIEMSMSEVWLSSQEFYKILSGWKIKFDEMRMSFF